MQDAKLWHFNVTRTHLSAKFAFAMALTVSLFAGCADAGQGNETWGGAYADEFAQELENAPNDYVREVLTDGVITHSEVQDAQSRVLDCASDAGFGGILLFVPNEPTMHFEYPAGSTQQAQDAAYNAISECEMQWFPFGWLYWATVTNPNSEDWDDLVAKCLVRHGVVPSPFTGADLARLQDEYAALYGIQVTWNEETGAITKTYPDGTVVIEYPQEGLPDDTIGTINDDLNAPPMTLPGGATIDDPVAAQCLVAPLR